jgi:hypothetical protein
VSARLSSNHSRAPRVQKLPDREVEAECERNLGRETIPPDLQLSATFPNDPTSQREDELHRLSVRDEFGSRDESPFRVLPTKKGFHARNPSGFQVHEGLIVQAEFPAI